ncbi:SDR family oxidoreductase [Hyalangium versicolor]|uniref:SDR family oxidoreductase n=1 Tax=Hyalangium versicolor TaxID=2861190 RepID=UPI001CCA0265|nr:SDR family oxidoreductase [Hyalangium versicolor]
MILVTGATGTVGRELVKQLGAKGAKVRAMTRHPEKVRPPVSGEIEFVRGDFEDRASLLRALEGIDTVFLLSAPGPKVAIHDLAMVEAAIRSRVRKMVKLAGMSAEGYSTFKVGSWHRPGEEALQTSGLAWTLLRPSSFASNTLRWAPAIRAGNPVPIATGDGKQGVIDPRDIAAVAAAVLTSNQHAGNVYTLTGPELLSAKEQLEVLSRVLKRPLKAVELTVEAARTQMIAAGVPEAQADIAAEASAFVRAGGSAMLANGVEAVLGHKPRRFEDWARDFAVAFA